MVSSSLDAFNKVVQEIKKKKGKLQELVLTEESYLDNLEAVERILLEAKKARKDDSMPKQLREREFIMFGNVQRIIDFHRKVFTTGLGQADGRAEKVSKSKNSKRTF